MLCQGNRISIIKVMEDLSEDILEIIPDDEILESCELVARELPITHYTYGFMTTCHYRHKTNPNYDVTFYRLRDRPESGIFVVILKTGNKTFGLLLYACEGYEDLLEYTLLNTSTINWNKRPLLQGILPRHYSLIQKVAREKNFVAELYVESTIQILPIKQALNYEADIPNDYYIRPLTSRDVESMYDSWPHKDVWTIDDMIYSIQCDLSFGLFSKETKEIKGWIMFTHYGGLGMLYIVENCRRMGYAKLLVKLMSKELARKDVTPFASIMPTNVQSLSLFHSLGYYKVTNIKYFKICESKV